MKSSESTSWALSGVSESCSHGAVLVDGTDHNLSVSGSRILLAFVTGRTRLTLFNVTQANSVRPSSFRTFNLGGYLGSSRADVTSLAVVALVDGHASVRTVETRRAFE